MSVRRRVSALITVSAHGERWQSQWPNLYANFGRSLIPLYQFMKLTMPGVEVDFGQFYFRCHKNATAHCASLITLSLVISISNIYANVCACIYIILRYLLHRNATSRRNSNEIPTLLALYIPTEKKISENIVEWISRTWETEECDKECLEESARIT